MSKQLKKTPTFANEKEEREFWQTHDSTEYVDWSKARKVTFPNLKPTTQSISLRLPQWMLQEIKNIANRQDVPYQSLIKVWLSESLAQVNTARATRKKLGKKLTTPRRGGLRVKKSASPVALTPTKSTIG